MGYRLEVDRVKTEYIGSGGKLYGYLSKERLMELKSYQWLLDMDFITGTQHEYWGYGYHPEILLNAQNFRRFIELYEEDYYKINPEHPSNLLAKLKRESKTDDYKIITWG